MVGAPATFDKGGPMLALAKPLPPPDNSITSAKFLRRLDRWIYKYQLPMACGPAERQWIGQTMSAFTFDASLAEHLDNF
jgi:hypothetical protein